MKKTVAAFIFSFVFASGALYANPVDNTRLSVTVSAKTVQGAQQYLSSTDAHGTPLIIKLVRQGDVKTLQSLSQYNTDGKFLLATDAYGNNLFHAAKNADTVQAAASLIRHYYGAKAARKIAEMVDAQNKLGETPLHAQINAAHSDTFRPIYRYTSLKKKNDIARNQLARLHGTDERIYTQHQAIYCQDIISAASANGITLLQAAQAQIPYNPQMANVAETIGHVLPCLAQN